MSAHFGPAAPAVAAGEQARLSKEERALGYIAWRLIGDWQSWVRRRVESISYETSNSIRRRVSVDLRLVRELFGKPVVTWNGNPMHYVPIALVRKQRLLRFDVRDEEDRVLPLITKHRNSAIAAGILTAAAQSVVANRLNESGRGFEILSPTRIVVPRELEDRFWNLAYLNPTVQAEEEAEPAISDKGDPRTIDQWEWHVDHDDQMTTNAGLEDWHALLASDTDFGRLLADVSNLFMICVPLNHEPERRRIIKFAYTEYLVQPAGPFNWLKALTVKARVAPAWNWIEDRLEGLPRLEAASPSEWVPSIATPEPKAAGLGRKILEAIGWTTRIGKFEAPAIAHGSSYHLCVSTPDGIQIRRARLVAVKPQAGSGMAPTYLPQRGNRNLHAVDLHVSRASPDQTANAYLNIKPESSFVVRAAFWSSMLTAAALTLLWAFGHRITSHNSHTDGVAAILIVIPGLFTAIAVRDIEHPLATSMGFGLRALATISMVLTLLAAGQVAAGSPRTWLGIALFAAAWSIAFILGVSWRLAARGRPHRTALMRKLDGARS
jgi:hypothetical protein